MMSDWIRKLFEMWVWAAVLGLLGLAGCGVSSNLTIRRAALGTEKWPLVDVVGVVDVDLEMKVPLADGVLDFLFAGLFGEEGPPAPTAAEIAVELKKLGDG